jgi:putative ABC transport system permease protein
VRLRTMRDVYQQRGSVGSTLGMIVGSAMLIVVFLAIAGIYTLMSFIVAQRWREIGVRSALGASPGRLVKEICGRSVVPLAAGALVGCVLAFLFTSAVDVEDIGGLRIPGVVPATAGLMIVVGLAALAGPARRAVRINAVEALRSN